ncbi:CWF19-like protein 2 [Selaginella moellendorffii]|uniref:CWF19-like protein 2 n=1 Tax=Selaginella moellendorffii TaxID=88036 RepID=UPI000D1C7B90|nr:CWF19-like protein 2 [Selaginella moellendorffii]|eukprot:XP_024526774.1 CWF19-like protein 2 [Selaginella moellendorffii]
MLGAVRFVSRDSVASSSNDVDREGKTADADDPEMLAKRKNAGLEWMSVAPSRPQRAVPKEEIAPSKAERDEKPPSNSKELNPHWKDGGEGFPEEEHVARRVPGGVGDGGASWLLKGLKRAQERAAREGASLPDVISDRWGSFDAFSRVSNKRAAHSNAHLHAIRDRKRKYEQEQEAGRSEDEPAKEDSRSAREGSRMRAPRVDGSLKWKSQRRDTMRSEDSAVLKAAAASYNIFENDGSFMEKFKQMQEKTDRDKPDQSSGGGDDAVKNKVATIQRRVRESKDSNYDRSGHDAAIQGRASESNGPEVDQPTADDDPVKRKIAAIQRRAQNKDSDGDKVKASAGGDDAVMKKITAIQRHAQENKDSDAFLASKIYRSRERYQADDEYDDVGIESDAYKKKSARKGMTKAKNSAVSQYNRIQTQNERCRYCFENSSRPKHLTIAIGNFTYLMLPPTSSLVPGHCYIVPSQHEGSTRNVDDDVWGEIRNFKKCLLKMFKEQEKDVIFLETAMNLSQQRRHCLVECIPVPPNVLQQGPLYFKKAIDEAEDEWSQHNAKKLIDTRGKGLRSSIPKNFPYFHVEFGLEGGYCHVIDNEEDFDSNFGRNVLIGMLKLPQEAMHQKAKHASFDHQTTAVKEFLEQWRPHDWTQMLQ